MAYGARSVIIVEDAIQVIPVLAAAFSSVPIQMLQNVTFSTFDSNPGTCRDSLVFASPGFSDCRTIQADQNVRHFSGASAPGSTSTHGLLSRALVARQATTQEPFPLGISTIPELTLFVRRHEALAKPVELTTPREIAQLLASPLSTRWLARPGASQAVLRALISGQTAGMSLHEWLRPDMFTELQLTELQDGLLSRMLGPDVEDADRAAIRQQFLMLGGRPEQLEHAVWTARVLPQILQRTIDTGTVWRHRQLIERRLADSPEHVLIAAMECEHLVQHMALTWNSFIHRVLLRSWSDPGYAEAYQPFLEPLYEKYRDPIADVLSIELLKSPSPSTWAPRLSALPKTQAAVLHLLAESCGLRSGWLFDLIRSPSFTRNAAVDVLSGYSKRILQEEGIATPERAGSREGDIGRRHLGSTRRHTALHKHGHDHRNYHSDWGRRHSPRDLRYVFACNLRRRSASSETCRAQGRRLSSDAQEKGIAVWTCTKQIAEEEPFQSVCQHVYTVTASSSSNNGYATTCDTGASFVAGPPHNPRLTRRPRPRE